MYKELDDMLREHFAITDITGFRSGTPCLFEPREQARKRLRTLAQKTAAMSTAPNSTKG